MFRLIVFHGIIGLLCVWVIRPSFVYAQESGKHFEAILMPSTDTVLSSSVPGYIKKINVKEGLAFQEGDILIEFDCRAYEMELEKINIEQKWALEKLKTAKKLFALKAMSQMDVFQANIDVKKSRLEKEKQKFLLEGCKVTAPFDGYVVELFAAPYQTVAVSHELIRLINRGVLKLELFVSSEYLSKFVKDSPFSVYVNETGQHYQAKVVAVVPLIDSVSQTFKVIGTFDKNDPSLLPGMSGRVDVE